MHKKFAHKEIEKKWQKRWAEEDIYKTADASDKPKVYVLDMFPYPSGDGLHVGHPKGYIATDIYSRYKRMSSHEVLHPMGWDAFGLPAENYAIKNKMHPRVAVEKNVARFKEQLQILGLDYDWNREINTTDPEFYKWTQWIFLKLLEKGLAYESYEPINWCPSCQTGLANEDLESDGTCERCGSEVTLRPMRQWVLRITQYADRMLEDLDTLTKWPAHIKEAQRNWIGRSEGALIAFDDIEIFTTRPDTIFGATFVVVSGTKDRFTGRYVTNPATKEKIPVWEAEYVLSDYGTGAIMGVPADDERDMEFAKKHGLPIVAEYQKAGFEDFGKKVVKYKLRDWVFSRQRYWGEPIPVIHCEKDGVVPVPEKDLPVRLPEVEHYEPTGTGESPLANITEWVNTTCPKCGGPGKRETNTMPQWAGSCWYYLRYIDPKNNARMVAPDKEKYWMPVDLYVGGAEHATRHLIYARFWHKFLYDIGAVSTLEPFTELHSVGLIIAEDGRKMSKRYGNVINPDDIVEKNGADTLRVYEMFMGPFENTIAWDTNNLVGAQRFLERANGFDEHIQTSEPSEITELLHHTIDKVTRDIESFKFNTAISTLMIFLNAAEKEGLSETSYKMFLRLLAPFAPHLTEELWEGSGEQTSIHTAPWPIAEQSLLVKDTASIAIQIDGKVRATITAAVDAGEEEVKEAALKEKRIADRLEKMEVVRTIYVPGRVLNFIIRPPVA